MDPTPYRQKATARGVRRTAFHEHLKAEGAVFGEIGGWERANWFARRGCGARRMSVFDPVIRRFIVMWYPTVGNALVRLDGPDSGHTSRADALDEALRFRAQAAAFAKGERDVPRRHRS